jgi:hypothetical protein
VLYQLLCVFIETPKYSLLFFWKKENPGDLFCLNIADLDFSNTFCITQCATLFTITFGFATLTGAAKPPCLRCTYATPRPRGAKPPLSRNESDIDFPVFFYFLLYILFSVFIHPFIRLNIFHSFFGKRRTLSIYSIAFYCAKNTP